MVRNLTTRDVKNIDKKTNRNARSSLVRIAEQSNIISCFLEVKFIKIYTLAGRNFKLDLQITIENGQWSLLLNVGPFDTFLTITIMI